MKIIPSIIAKDQKELDIRLGRVIRYSNLFHLDVMDGEFVRNTSLQFNLALPNACYEAHLMVKNPVKWLDDNAKKMDRVIFHAESPSLSRLISDAKKLGKKVSLALNPETEIRDIEPFLELVDRVLVMTVSPGAYGAPFLPETLRKIKRLKELYPGIEIETDGGVTPQTIKSMKMAGAGLFVCGSYIQDNDAGKAIAEMEALIR
ncbi:MAG: ribulose-phosphate 3-epimerase [Candidatus Aenigmarchaeota archaeon]|nr:ribulose-phosphate 3-epimerase [Candidatus Aenigmarchaeota archaeon]